MELTELKTGTRLEVSWFEENEQPAEPDWEAADSQNIYVSQLLEPITDGMLLVAMPIREFRLVNWPEGCMMRVSFIQQDSCVWSFTASLIERVEKDRIMSFRIKANDDLARLQRRAWYRLPCSLGMTFRFIADASEPENSISHKLFQAVTRNISGGGAAFVTNQALPDQPDVEITLQLDNELPVSARGRILRVSDINGSPSRKQVSLQFTEMSRPDQDVLVQFVFQQQLQRTQKDRKFKT